MQVVTKNRKVLALAIAAFCGGGAVTAQNEYVTGDFHQHTTYTDGSYSIHHMMSKNNEFGLDWWANSEHGGGFNRNGNVSGIDLDTTIYWDGQTGPILGDTVYSGGHQVMWRWQMLMDSTFAQIVANRALYPAKTIIQGYEMNVPGHEHGSVGIIANQFSTTPNCNPIAQFEYMFDNSDGDISGGASQGWVKSNLSGHAKTLEAIEWLQANYPAESYLVPAHPERRRSYSVADFRDMNNAGPDVCFGFESMPGHQKSGGRGGYGSSANGNGTYGGCGVYAAEIGGLWDAMLSEGRGFWLFANSDFHAEDGDFYPGEYQKTYTYVQHKNAQGIVDGLRLGNSFVVEGDLIDSLDFHIETINRNDNVFATMGSTTVITQGKSLKVSIIAHDPQGANHNTYSYYTHPELNHIDLIMGSVGGRLEPSHPNYNTPNVSTTSVIARFDATGGITDSNGLTSIAWEDLGSGFVKITYVVPNVTDSCYFRLRGSNLGLDVENETDAAGNPLADALVGTNNAEKAFADLWFYSNPIFINTTKTVEVEFPILGSDDDLEENIAPYPGQVQNETIGDVDWSSSDLELGSEGSNSSTQLVGLRFAELAIDNNKTIRNAYIQFEVDETKPVDPTNLHIWVEDADNSAPFQNVQFSLSSRAMSADSVAWTIPVGECNAVNSKYNSTDITSIVQTQVNRAGWANGNAMTFFIKGTGRRCVESYNGEAPAAAKLMVTMEMSASDIRAMQVADSIAAELQALSDSILAAVEDIHEEDYTVPSYTVFLSAKYAVIENPTQENVDALFAALDQLISAEMPYSISMSIYEDATSKMGFNWLTNLGVSGGTVQIITGAADSSAFATPEITLLATSDSVLNLNYNVSSNDINLPSGTKRSYMSNKAVATTLMPNTLYSFRVGKEGAWSEIGTFTTADTTKEAFSFIYFTDPQANTSSMFDISQKTTHAARNMFPNTDFFLSCGDLVETSGNSNSEWEYEQFFSTQQDIWLNQPLMAVGGNHDKSNNKNFSVHFNTANTNFDNAMSTNPGSVYSFVYGDALFLALSYEDYSRAGYLDSLATWMSEEVKNHPEVKWRIAYYHKTMYTGASHQGDSDGKTVREAMGPVFDSLKIDWALQGHDHVYEVIGPVYNKQLVPYAITSQDSVDASYPENVTGLFGGNFNVKKGTLYFLNNSGGRKKYSPRTEAQMAAQEASLGMENYFGLFTGKFGQTGEPTFSHITVTTDTITVSTYTVDDAGIASLYDSYTISKSVSAPEATLALPAKYNEIKVGDTLSIVAHAFDSDGIIAKVEFFANEVKLAEDSVYPYIAQFTATSVEGVVISAIATDNDGLTSQAATAIAIVRPEDYFSAGYVAGDFHQHTTYTDGSYTIHHMMAKNNEFRLNWWANSEHGGAYNRNGNLSGTDAGTTVYWDETAPENILGDVSISGGHQNMWRWQALMDSSFTYVVKNRVLYPNNTLIQSYEMNVPGHEHGSVGIIANQFDSVPNCSPIAQFEYMFDNSDRDTTGGASMGWSKSTLSGHAKTLEAIEWLQANYPEESYLVPAHPERQRKYTIAHFRDMNTAGPDVCFGFESMPGHQKSGGRGGYGSNADGGGTFGGCGIYAAEIGGLWDAMLSEGRGFWLFANSDFHSEGGDFYPGEYQKTYTFTTDKSAQAIVNGLRSGNSWVVEGDLIDSLEFNLETTTKEGEVIVAAMGSNTVVEKGEEVTISIVAHDPQGANHNTYSNYTNPELNHIDLIMGQISEMLTPDDESYNVPSVSTTKVIARFDANGGIVDANGLISQAWENLGNGFVKITYTLNANSSCYFRLRGSNLGVNVENETDSVGNPLPDALVGTNNAEKAFADLWFYSNPIFVTAVSTPYKLEDVASLCETPSFCMPLIAVDTVSECIGYDITISYDTTAVTPGNITLASNLIDASYASVLKSVVDSTGTINIAVYLNASAPAGTSFNGVGELLCIGFNKNAMSAGNSTEISATITESYVTNATAKTVEAGVYTSEMDTIAQGVLRFWRGNEPIAYDSENPARFAITNIYGANSAGEVNYSYAVQPDANGMFEYITNNGEAISIERNIDDSANVHPVINSADAVKALKVVVRQGYFTPSAAQIIAMDVNMDGQITSGDVSQINQRGVGILPEFAQAWNANTMKSSKDWLFIESSLFSTPEYTISATYPNNDGIGYSKYNVPASPFTTALLSDVSEFGCTTYGNIVFKGILLGDVDGNYINIPNDGILKNGVQEAIAFNLENAEYRDNSVSIPVTFSFDTAVQALDFDIRVSEDIADVVAVNYPSEYLCDWTFNAETRIMKLGMLSLDNLDANAISVVFSTASTKLKSSDFSGSLALLNGKSVQFNVDEEESATSARTVEMYADVYPNPASGTLNILCSENATAEVIDVHGKMILSSIALTADIETSLNIEKLATGVYTIKIYNANFSSAKELMVK